MLYSPLFFKEVLSFWNIRLRRVCQGFTIPGSPERTEFRVVIESADNNLYLLEKLLDNTVYRKKKIVETLDLLHDKHLKEVNVYLKSIKGEQVVLYKGSHWQLSNFIDGVTLNRPSYAFDEWRGQVLAEFLINLDRAAREIPFFKKEEAFSLKEYVIDLISTIKQHKQGLVKNFVPVLEFLEKDFFKAYEQFPVSFCHGDYHPVNIVWSECGIKKVIDWEFLGYKPEIYDIANLIGCVGIEDPQCLKTGLIMKFISILREKNMVSDLSWQYLFEFIIAIRFGWLSEWLRKNDAEMIEMEEIYMKLLIDNRDYLKEAWGLVSLARY